MSAERPYTGTFAALPVLPGARTSLAGLDIHEMAESGGDELAEAVREIESAGLERAQGGGRSCAAFYISMLLLKTAGLRLLRRRWALRESRRMERELARRFLDDPSRGSDLMREAAGFEVVALRESYAVSIAAYVGLSARMDAPWKLVNQSVSGGYVRLPVGRIFRLAREGCMNSIEALMGRIRSVPDGKAWGEAASSLRASFPDPPPGRASAGAVPPCMRGAADALEVGENLSNAGRFMLAAYMLQRGMPQEDVANLFRGAPDFSEKITGYHVRRIAERGYSCPSCDTIDADGLCRRSARCGRIRHPMQYR